LDRLADEVGQAQWSSSFEHAYLSVKWLAAG
jgi:hypothetical protein